MLTAPSSAEIVPFQPKPSERFVRLGYNLLDSPEWQNLPLAARALYPEIAKQFNGKNNGQIQFSVRDAERILHIGRATAGRALKLLEQLGVIVCRKRGSFNRKAQKATVSEWYLPNIESHQRTVNGSVAGFDVPLNGSVAGRRVLDKKVSIDIDREEKTNGLPTKEGRPESEEEKKRRRLIAEGKSPFTGCPIWKRPQP